MKPRPIRKSQRMRLMIACRKSTQPFRVMTSDS